MTWRIAEHRDDPTITERTLAALVSRATTRVYIERENIDPSISGVYSPGEDKIYLYKCEGGVPAVAVALEEAGHSLHRDEYIELNDFAQRITKKLEAWNPVAPILLDWYEDARVYTALKQDYPGAAPDLDLVWRMRRRDLEKTAFTVTVGSSDGDNARMAIHDVLNEALHCVDEYEARRAFTTFREVLEYLDKLTDGKPLRYPPPPPRFVLVVGRPNDFDGKGMPDLKEGNIDKYMRGAGGLLRTIKISFVPGGNNARPFAYSWRVIAVEEMDQSV